jgi:hypothetical protein
MFLLCRKMFGRTDLVHVAIPDEKIERFEQQQRRMIGESVRRLAEVAAEAHQGAHC